MTTDEQLTAEQDRMIEEKAKELIAANLVIEKDAYLAAAIELGFIEGDVFES